VALNPQLWLDRALAYDIFQSKNIGFLRLIWGKYDRFISSELGNEIAIKLPNARLEVIDKAGHYVHMDKPQDLVQVVTRFFDEVPDEVAVKANCSLLSYA